MKQAKKLVQEFSVTNVIVLDNTTTCTFDKLITHVRLRRQCDFSKIVKSVTDFCFALPNVTESYLISVTILLQICDVYTR